MYVDVEGLKRNPKLGVAIGLAGAALFAFIAWETFQEGARVQERKPRPLQAADLARLPRTRAHWIELGSFQPACHIAMIEVRGAPESWFFEDIMATYIPLAVPGATPVVARYDGEVDCLRGVPKTLKGILCLAGSGVWGTGLPPELRTLDGAEPRVLMVGMTPDHTRSQILLMAVFGLLSLGMAAWFAALWRRQAFERAAAAEAEQIRTAGSWKPKALEP